MKMGNYDHEYERHCSSCCTMKAAHFVLLLWYTDLENLPWQWSLAVY